MQKLKDLLRRITSLPYADKLYHVAAGVLLTTGYWLLLIGLYIAAVTTGFGGDYVPMYLMMTPHFVNAIVIGVFVHSSKEVNDYILKRLGENHEPSLYDFLAGMTGSVAAALFFF